MINVSRTHFPTCLLLLKTLLLFASQAQSTQTITVAASDFPPYFIFKKTTDKFNIAGFDVDLDKHISAMTGIEFEYIPCPWIRCLKLLKEGKIDMASTIMKTKDREAFLDFLSPGYQLVNQSRHVYFYQRQADSRPILEFSDLLSNNLAIGVVRGDVHFPQFDQSTDINKFYISDYAEGLDLLLKEKIDLVAILETQSDWLQDKYQGKVSMTEFIHRQDSIAYRALSKNGTALNLKAQINLVLQKLNEQGVITRLQEKYRHQIR